MEKIQHVLLLGERVRIGEGRDQINDLPFHTNNLGLYFRKGRPADIEAKWVDDAPVDLSNIDVNAVKNVQGRIKEVMRELDLPSGLLDYLKKVRACAQYNLNKDYCRIMPYYSDDVVDPSTHYSGEINSKITSWGVHGIPCLDNGWSVIAQSRGDMRLPEVVRGVGIGEWDKKNKWHVFRPKDSCCHLHALPSWSWPVFNWQANSPHANVSCFMGGEHHLIAIDIDVLDKEMSDKVFAIAQRVLGRTDFIRQGKPPKLALIYRAKDGQKIASVSKTFVEDESVPVDERDVHMVEILSSGKQMTFFGVHHGGKNYFRWLGEKNPVFNSPEEAPEITQEQIDEFLECVEKEVAPFKSRYQKYTGNGNAVTSYNSEGYKVTDDRNYQFTDGKISDGRNQYAFTLTYRVLREAYHEDNNVIRDKALLEDVMLKAVAIFQDTAVCTGRWTPALLKNEFYGRVNALAEKARHDASVFGRKPVNSSNSYSVITDSKPQSNSEKILKRESDKFDEMLSGYYVFGQDQSGFYEVPASAKECLDLPLPRIPASAFINVSNPEIPVRSRLLYGCEALIRFADRLFRCYYEYSEETGFKAHRYVYGLGLTESVGVDLSQKFKQRMLQDIKAASYYETPENLKALFCLRYAEYLVYIVNLEWFEENNLRQFMPDEISILPPDYSLMSHSVCLSMIDLHIPALVIEAMNDMMLSIEDQTPMQEDDLGKVEFNHDFKIDATTTNILDDVTVANVVPPVVDVKQSRMGRRRRSANSEDNQDTQILSEDSIHVAPQKEEVVYESKNSEDGEFAFLGGYSALQMKGVERTPGNVKIQREEKTEEISDNLHSVFDHALNNAYSAMAGDIDAEIRILKSPTGSGKTSHMISRLVGDPRTYLDVAVKNGDKVMLEHRPIVILMPNYNNIAEALARAKVLCLDPNKNDDDLASDILKTGFCKTETDAYARIEEVRGLIQSSGRNETFPPLDIQVYNGKVKAGCKMLDWITELQSAEVSAGALCKGNAYNHETKQFEETYCQYYDTCKYIAQFEKLKTAHIVMMPHAMYSANIPDSLKNVRMVIVDESVSEQFLEFNIRPRNNFKVSRYEPAEIGKPPVEGGDALVAFNKRKEKIVRLNKSSVIRNLLMFDIMDHYDPLEEKDIARWLLNRENENQSSDDENKQIHWVGKDVTDEDGKTVICVRDVMGSISTIEEFLVTMGGRDGAIYPNMEFRDVATLCSENANTNMRTERHFWEAVKDRFEKVAGFEKFEKRKRELEDYIIKNEDVDDPIIVDNVLTSRERLVLMGENPYHVRGEFDTRIQFLKTRVDNNPEPQDCVRVSWRNTPNWIDAPTLLLDASADPNITKRIWGKDNVNVSNIVEDASSVMNMDIIAVTDSSYSNNMLVSDINASVMSRLNAGNSVRTIREAITRLCGLYGKGRVVVGSGKTARDLITRNWERPTNSDYCHYGAMRGIDAYKEHVACISIGRMEPPIEVIDAIAGCLSYDDANPEKPFNEFGNGCEDKDGKKPLFQPMTKRKVRMRDGGHAYIDVPCVPNFWGARIQNQKREEEIIQLIGRLRPIYRKRKAIQFLMSNVIPEGLILSDLCHVTDIVGIDDMTKIPGARNAPANVIKHRMGVRRMTQIMDVARTMDDIIIPSLMSSKHFALRLPKSLRNKSDFYNYLFDNGFRYVYPERMGDNYTQGREAEGYACVKWRTSDNNDYETAFIKVGSSVADGKNLASDLEMQVKVVIAHYNKMIPDDVHAEVVFMPSRIRGFTRENDKLADEHGHRYDIVAREEANERFLKNVIGLSKDSGVDLIKMQMNKHSVVTFKLSPHFLSVLAKGDVTKITPRTIEEATITLGQFNGLMDVEGVHGRSLTDIYDDCLKLVRSISSGKVPEEDNLPF